FWHISIHHSAWSRNTAVVIVGVRETRQSRSWRARPTLFSQIRPRRRPGTKRVFGAILAVVALWLRLVWPAPPTIAHSDITALAGLGEHALCLAALSRSPAWTSPASGFGPFLPLGY